MVFAELSPGGEGDASIYRRLPRRRTRRCVLKPPLHSPGNFRFSFLHAATTAPPKDPRAEIKSHFDEADFNDDGLFDFDEFYFYRRDQIMEAMFEMEESMSRASMAASGMTSSIGPLRQGCGSRWRVQRLPLSSWRMS